MNQRWLFGHAAYRRPTEPIRTAEYDVAAIADDATPKAFVATHHYAGTYPAARFRYGLYRRGDLVGVAVFSHPCSDRVLTNVFPGEARASVELGRFVLLDEVPGNGETWFLARCFEALRQDGIAGVVSFSDPVARTTVDGRVIFPGHVGTIYQASNGVYLGRGAAQTLRILPDGRALSHRAITKLRAGARGWRYVAAQLEAHGADTAPHMEESRPADATSLHIWADAWIARLTRPLRHPGNHKYAWPLARASRRVLPTSLDYPKRLAA